MKSASGYLRDLGHILAEQALRARSEGDEARKDESSDFEAGRLRAFYDVVYLMQQQAVTFNIEPEDLATLNYSAYRLTESLVKVGRMTVH